MVFDKGLNEGWSQDAAPGQAVPFRIDTHQFPLHSGNGFPSVAIIIVSLSQLGSAPALCSLLLFRVLITYSDSTLSQNPLQRWGAFLLNQTLPGLSWRDGRQRGKDLPLLGGRVTSYTAPLYITPLNVSRPQQRVHKQSSSLTFHLRYWKSIYWFYQFHIAA